MAGESGFRWNQHIGEHGITPLEAEQVVFNARPPFPQDHGDDKLLVRGQTAAGLYVQVIFVLDDGTVFVIHARPLKDNEKRRLSPPVEMMMKNSNGKTKGKSKGKQNRKAIAGKSGAPEKRYSEMTTAELEEATREFDGEIDPKKLKPLSPEMRRRWEGWKKKFGRPKVGKGAVRVLVSIEGGLLERADALASRRGVPRSRLVAEALEALMARQGSAA